VSPSPEVLGNSSSMNRFRGGGGGTAGDTGDPAQQIAQLQNRWLHCFTVQAEVITVTLAAS
jgi:hypothetical protein